MKKSTQSGGIRRRDFLVLGSAATVGIAASVSASTSGPLGVLTPAGQHLSVGFAEPSNEPQRLRRADAIRTGGSDFLSQDARVTVHGLWRPESLRDRATEVSVSVFHAIGGEAIPFIAWHHSRRSSAAGVSFKTPLQPDGTLAIGVERSRSFSLLAEPARLFGRLFRAVPENAIDLPVQESLAASGKLCRLGASAPRLQRGTYFIALLDTPRQPDWNAITAGTDFNVRSGSVLRFGEAPVDFEYLVVSVDRV